MKRRRRLLPAPPPTPEGMMWARRDGKAVLVDAEAMRRQSAGVMRIYDGLPRQTRDEAKKILPLRSER